MTNERKISNSSWYIGFYLYKFIFSSSYRVTLVAFNLLENLDLANQKT